jgi:hypothetical protein
MKIFEQLAWNAKNSKICVRHAGHLLIYANNAADLIPLLRLIMQRFPTDLPFPLALEELGVVMEMAD